MKKILYIVAAVVVLLILLYWLRKPATAPAVNGNTAAKDPQGNIINPYNNPFWAVGQGTKVNPDSILVLTGSGNMQNAANPPVGGIFLQTGHITVPNPFLGTAGGSSVSPKMT